MEKLTLVLLKDMGFVWKSAQSKNLFFTEHADIVNDTEITYPDEASKGGG
jgi:hypothetical protein